MEEHDQNVTCVHCGKTWDKEMLAKSCSNCFACTGCEAYICSDCRYEIVVIPPKPMKRTNQKD